MNKETLIQLFKAPYKRQAFIDNALLPTFQGKVANLTIYDQQGVQEIDLTASEQNYAVSVVKYGEFQTLDELPRTVELYEVIVNDNKQIERSRVGLGALVKKHIIGNNAVLVNFAYQSPEKRTWRFSFIARDGVFQDGEMQITDTHPKRYTYVFGEPEETYKTALDRFFILGNELEITINKIKDAFGVEAMSKAFFDEYRDVHYAGFVDYLMRSNFKKSAFNGNDKDVRDFVKKLLGRIVFLYFLQKKGWLGAKDTSYKNGDKNFMTNFFKKAGANDAFYANWLSKLFFDALNNERPNDDFTMPDGEVVKIPYLNGGLFEKETEKYDFLTFPADLFTNLFEFFDQYNFTIFEDSPEEHTVAVDPEMLGHIFENLLEDNKDKGAFYTPKEIVHYMTQESLIEYLHTQLTDADRTELENFVKNKDNKLSKEHKAAIDQKLDTVKICDPAIGSGAFPMGLLQEIFGLKERIAYDLGYKVWSPATVKENIIQKSIYGVDIERGAVDIARLRFWLSLIVDEEMPKALPNLDYKIVVGNSLVSKFDDTVIEIDWSEDTAKEGLFGQEIAEDKKRLLKEISSKQAKYFTADNALKEKLNREIRNLKLDILTKQLELMIENKGFKSDSMQGLNKKQIETWQQTQDWKKALNDIKALKKNPEQDFNHFDWKLDFPEVLNPLVNEITGFDIVIGNPPYIKEYTSREAFDGFRSSPYYQGKMDIWYGFACKALDLLKDNGVECFIAQNNWITSAGASILREKVSKESEIILFTDFGNYKVFKSAGIQTMVYLLRKREPRNIYDVKFSLLKIDNITENELAEFLSFNEWENSEYEKFIYNFDSNKDYTKSISFSNTGTFSIIEKLLAKRNFTLSEKEVIQGIVGAPDNAFIIDESQINNFDNTEKAFIKKYYTNSSGISNQYLIYLSDKNFGNNKLKDFPNLFKHFEPFKIELERAKIQYKTPSKPYYFLHRERDENFFKKGAKIICQIRCAKPSFFYTDKEYYVSRAANVIKSERIDLKYLTALLNSKLLYFYYKNNGATQGNLLKYDKGPLLNIPINHNPKSTLIISKAFDFHRVVNNSETTFQIEIPKNHIAEAFEEVIDALVFELYFPEEFAEKGIAIEKYAKDIFKSIDGLSEEEQIKAIREAYETLREKKNPLRNQILLMQIELKELLNPILSL